MAGMSTILRLRDINASKRFLTAWKNGKVVCPHVECKQNKILLEASGLVHHYRIMHPNISNANDDQLLISEGKAILRDLMSQETRNNLNLLSDMRRKQVRIHPQAF